MKKFNKPYIKNGRFCHNLKHRTVGFFFSSILMMFKSFWLRKNLKKIKAKDFVCDIPFSCQVSEKPVITWIGHSSFLIQIAGVNILTDPVLGEASVLYRRIFKPGISKCDLPNIDFVLISHNHMDHMDAKSLISLKTHKNIHFLVPMGNKRWFDKRGFTNVREYCWWDKDLFACGLDKSIKFAFLPASHWSQRGFFDKNKTLWGSWIVEHNGFKIFFAGDTAYDSHFKEIAKEYKDINVALMPIGPCEPRKWIAHHHVDAKESVNAFLDLDAENFIHMHWGTFPLGAEDFDLPVKRLVQCWFDYHDLGLLHGKKLHLSKIGQQIEFSYPELQEQAIVKKDVLDANITNIIGQDRHIDQNIGS